MNIEEKITILEKSLLDTKVRKNIKTLTSLISKDFREVSASGNCFGLDEIVNNVPNHSDWSCKTQAWKFRMLSDDIAQISYKAYIVHSAEGKGVYSLRMSLWKNEERNWRMVYHQGTKVTPFKLEA